MKSNHLRANLKKLLSVVIVVFVAQLSWGTIFYSQNNGGQSFADLTNWNDAANGSGSNPVAGDLTSGTHIFLIQDGHTVSIDQDISVDGLIVGQGGATATLGINGLAVRNITVASQIYVDANGDFRPNNSSITHNITLTGNSATVTNLGTFQPRRDGNSLATFTVTGTGTINITGTSRIDFHTLDVNAGGTISTSGSMIIYGDLTLSNGSSLTGSATIENRANVSVDATSSILTTAGSFQLDNTSDQSFTCDGDCEFWVFQLDNGPGADGVKTINGEITVEQELRILADAVWSGTDSVFVNDGLRIDNDNGWTGSSPIVFNALITDFGFLRGPGSAITLGNSDLIFNGPVSMTDNSSQFSLNGDVTINNGGRLYVQESVTFNQAVSTANTFTLGDGALLYVRGLNNFPTNFATYTLSETSRTFYDGTAGFQFVVGGITFGDLILTNDTKNANGSLNVRGNLTVNNATTLNISAPGFNLNLGGNVNGNGGTLICNNTVTLDGVDQNQTLDPDVSYTFNNFVINNDGPITAIRTKNIDNDMSVSGDFTITNTGGNASNYLIVDMDANAINGGGAGVLTINDNVELRTAGATSFNDMVTITSGTHFATTSLSSNSTINFDGGSDQSIPSTTYGNIILDNGDNKTLTGNITINGDVDGDRDNYVFNDAGFQIELYGNWDMGSFGNGQARTNMTGDFFFLGADQTSNGSDFFNVTFGGTGTKTMNYDINVGCGFTVNNGVTFTSNYRIDVGCDVTVLGTGILRQTAQGFYLGGTVDQTIDINDPTTSFLNNVEITNTGGSVILNTDLYVNGYLDMNNGGASTLNIDDDSLFVGGDFLMYAEDNFSTANGSLILDGSADQILRNGNVATVYNNVFFRTGGEKRLAANTIDINGNVEGDVSVTLNQNGQNMNVAGDWTHVGSIAGGAGDDIYFDGGNQTITGSEFNTVQFAGTDTKTLGTNISVKGQLFILIGSTLDVSPNDYQIALEGNWNNDYGGSFTPRNGTVSFIGDGSNIYTGGTGAGKAFNNLTINLNTSSINLAVANRSPDAVDTGIDINIDGDLAISKGRFVPGNRDTYLGGNLFVSSNGRYVGSNGPHDLIFDGSATTKTWTPGANDTYRSVFFDAVGATWTLEAEVEITGADSLVVNNGKFSLNGNNLTFLNNNSGAAIHGANAELEIDAGATLTMGTNTNCDLINDGGTLRVVGTNGNRATITSASTYDIIQTSGTIIAEYYTINGTRGNGVDIQGGSIDGTQNFSNGTFSGGVGTSYLTIYDGAFSADTTIRNVTFNESSSGNPTNNVSHTAGFVLTFEDPKGTAAGPGREDDIPDGFAADGQVRWVFTSGFLWTGLDGTDNTNWDRPNNWSTLAVPISTSDVILDHTNVSGPYTVNINTTYDAIEARAASITVSNSDASGKITLDIDGKNLNVFGDLSIAANDEIEQSSASDTLFVDGSFTNTSGILDGASSVVVFDGSSGNHSISTNSGGSANRDFNEVVLRGGATYKMNDVSQVVNILIEGSTLDLGDANNRLEVQGNLTVSDSGSITHSNGEIRFEGTTGTQLIDFGGASIFDVDFRGGSKKTITGNMSVENDVLIRAGTDTINAGGNFIFVQRDWRNFEGTNAFTQTGGGTVVFNGSLTQDIGQSGDSETTFNSVIFQGNGQKTVAANFSVDGDIQVLMNTNVVVELQPGVTVVGNGGNNRFSMQDGILRLEGTQGFPTGFEDVNLLGGEVRYETNSLGADQDVAGLTYYRLRIRETGGAPSNKNALGNIIVEENFYNTNDVNTQLNMNCFDLTINGGMDIEPGSPQIDWGSGCITTCGTGGTLILGENITAIDGDLTSFHNISVDNNGVSELRLASNLTMEGSLEITNGSRFDMRTFTVTNTCSDNPNPTTFILSDNAELETNVAGGTTALPQNFGNYSISSTSLVEYLLDGNQDIFTDSGRVVYGNLQLEGGGTKTLDSTLSVEGDFDMDAATILNDNGNDMTFSGDLAVFNNYTSTNSLTTFDGNDQTIRVDNGTTATFNDVFFTGTGTKLFWNDEVYNFAGDFKVDSNAIIDFTTYDQDVSFSGDSIIVNGALNHNGGDNDFRFSKAGTQIVDLGPNHSLAHLEIKTGADVFIINNGLNVIGNGGAQNFVEIETGASLDLDTMTHIIGQDQLIITGTLNSANANLTFNQAGNQNIDAFEANNVIFEGTGDKDMDGIWRMNDITIGGAARVDFNGQDTIVVRGDWISTSDLDREDGVVVFQITDSIPKTIQTNNVAFAQVKFEQISTDTVTYTMADDFLIDDSVRIGTGAILDLEGNTFILGFPADGGTDREDLVIETGAELQIDAGASLLFDGAGSVDASIDVYGTLSVVGNPSSTASISRNNNGRELDIDIIGGTIAARYYSISNLVNEGLVVDANSTIDATNNFSDGTFSNMQEGQGAVYLQVEADVTGLADIANISFLHSGPTVGNDFNVKRDRLDGGVLTFADIVAGSLAGFEYEDETAGAGIGGQIVWPAVTETNWLGGDAGGVNDWFLAGNWDNGVPDSTKSAIIGSRPFLPIIESGGADTAYCKNLELTANAVTLTLRDGIDLFVRGDATIGTSNVSASINVQSATSDILIGGNLAMANNAIFVNGGAKIKMMGLSASATIDIDDQTLNDLEFDGGITFSVIGNLDVDGDFIMTNGNIAPSTNNYLYNVAGNWDASGGTFSTAVNGTVTLDGNTQMVTNSAFDNLIIAGTGCKTVVGTMLVNDELIVNECIQASAGSAIDMNDNVTINASGSFDDGGETHTFAGVNWVGTGAFPVNTGTIQFDRTGGTQNIFAAKFNSLLFTGTSRIELEGDVDVTGDVNFNNTINEFHTKTFLLDNTTGTGTFTLDVNETIRVTGADNFPRGFSTYTMDPTSNTVYNGTGAQSVRGGFDYGDIFFQNISTKTIISGDVGVTGSFNIQTGATVDVSANNYNISVAGAWNNDDGGSFIARKGTVTFNGTGAQALNVGEHPTDGDKSFWSVTVNNSSASANVDVNGADIYIDSTLNVTDGTFTLVGIGIGFTAYVGGSLQASGGGSFATSGIFHLNSTDNATLALSGNSSTFLNIEIDATSNTIYQLGSELIVNGYFDLQTGEVQSNGNSMTLGTDINDAVTINGTLDLDAGSELLLGNQTSLTVTSSGTFKAIGTSNNSVSVTRRYSTGDYNFVVNGNIAAQNYIFSNMSSQGIFISNTATIDNTNNLSNGIFTNPASGGVALRIETTDEFTTTAGNRIENVSFPVNPGNGTFNVGKTVVTTDTLEFYNSNGALSGEDFDNDPNDLINWTGPRRMIWTGAKNTDWFDINNWMATSGPTQVPDSVTDAEIPFVTNQPIIDVSGAQANALSIENGAIVIINTPNDTASDLTIYGELSIEGLIRTNTSNDVLEVRGNWSRVNGGSYTYGSGGKVIMANTTSTVSLNNGLSPFYDLEINSTGSSVQLSTDIVIDNDLNLTNGILDVTTSNSEITVGGSFTSTGILNERNGTITFLTSDTDVINAPSTDFYNISMEGTGTLQLTNELTVDNIFSVSDGTLDLNTNDLLIGDGTGSDLLNIDGGTVSVDVSESIKVDGDGSIDISSGGLLQVIGTDLSNRAFVTNQGGTTDKYSITVSTGGTLAAKFYTFSHLGNSGLTFLNGGLVDLTNNLSYGTFDNGEAGRTFITFNNTQNLTGNDQIEYVEFPTNPGSNARNAAKTNGLGAVKFYYAFGDFHGEDYDGDEGDLIEWDADMLWTALGGNTNWNDPSNWDPLLTEPIIGLVPTSNTDVLIPDAATTPFDPILEVTGRASDLEIATGGIFTIDNDNNLIVTDSVIVEGTLTFAPGTVSDIRLGGSWISTSGTFNNGNSSRIMFRNADGTESISSNDPFCRVRILSLSPSTGIMQTSGNMDIDCDLVIDAGTLAIGSINDTIKLAGNWDNNITTASTGFNGGVGTVMFDGTSDQSISQDGNMENFYNLVIANSGGVDVNMDTRVTIEGDLTINDGSNLDVQTSRLFVLGDWTNNNTVDSEGFKEGTGLVRFDGTSTQTITHASGNETFYNFVLNNNSVGTALSLGSNLSITNRFSHLDGVIGTGVNSLIILSTTPSDYSGWSNSNFINGNLRRHIASNTSTYEFPIGQGTTSSDYFRIDLLNNNLVTTSYVTGSVTSIVEAGSNVDDSLAVNENGGFARYLTMTGETALWTLTPDGQPTGGDYGTRAYLDNFAGLSDDLFGILKRPNGSTTYKDWTDGQPATTLPDDGQPGRTLASGYAERTGWTSFSQFGIGTSDIPLPITLASFDVKATGFTVVVEWTTVIEVNNDYFIIERSTDGLNFEAIGIVDGAGTTGESISYTYTDVQPESGVSYYRLKQVDFDGKSETFEIRAVSIGENIAEVVLHPNPASDFIIIPKREGLINIEIYSSVGISLMNEIPSGYETMDISELPSGVYSVIIKGVNWIEKTKLVVTK